jgi:serine/threonine-protein kinase
MAFTMQRVRRVQLRNDSSRDATQPIQIIDGEVVPLPKRDNRYSRLGDYDVIAPLARGGMGGVYLGADRRTNERVAIKVLDPHFASVDEIVARMFAEFEVSGKVDHPGLLDVRAADRSADGIPFLVMEYLDGENLGALSERGRLEIGAIASIGAQIAAALAAMHSAGIVHCDVKPDNVFVLYQPGLAGWPCVKVIDFGVSRFMDQPVGEATIAGTPAYMPPEQWRGTVTAKSDVYALGCLLFELITGNAPFTGTLPQLMLAHSEQRPARPSWLRQNLPVEFERLVQRALAKEPGMRPKMDEMVRELTALAYAHAPGAVEHGMDAMVG